MRERVNDTDTTNELCARDSGLAEMQGEVGSNAKAQKHREELVVSGLHAAMSYENPTTPPTGPAEHRRNSSVGVTGEWGYLTAPPQPAIIL